MPVNGLLAITKVQKSSKKELLAIILILKSQEFLSFSKILMMTEIIDKEFLAILTIVVAILVPLFIYWKQKENKRLLVETVANIPLIALDNNGFEGLEITFDGKAIPSATVLLVKISCIGNRPIKTDDIESEIRLEFEKEAVVLASEIVKCTPERLPVAAVPSGRSLVFSKNLLNSGDNFTCRVLLKESKGDFEALCRIAGLSKIEKLKIKSTGYVFTYLFGVLIFILSISMAQNHSNILIFLEKYLTNILFSIAIIGGFISLASSSWYLIKMLRKN